MIVKAIYKDKDFDYFNDKVTGEQRKYGDIFECDDEIATERIKGKFVKKATKEEKEYYANQTTVDDEDLEPSDNGSAEDNTGNNGKNNDDKGELPKDANESTKVKPLDELTMDELIQIGIDENIELSYPKDDTARSVIIETINKVRAERLEQSNNN